MILLALMAQAALGDLSGYPELARYQHLPRAVRVLMDRRMGCNHWTGEEPYDRARAREIARAVARLDCTRLDRDEARLLQRYRRDPRVLEALVEARDRLW